MRTMHLAHTGKMDLNLFVVLEAVFAEGSTTKAGKKLGLTQPAISHALARLRELFGDSMFLRQGNRMVPTPLTRVLIDRVRLALRALDGCVSEGTRFVPFESRRTFHLGVADVLEATALPPLFRHLVKEAPAITVASVRTDRRKLESDLCSGSLDVAMDVLLVHSSAVKRACLVRDTLAVVVRQDHPAIAESPDLDTYLAQSHVLVSSRRQGPGLEDLELARIGRQRRIGLRCQHHFAACRVVEQTDLVLTMPKQYAQVLSAPFGHHVFPFPFPTEPLEVYLYWHVNADIDPANAWLRARLLTLFGEPEVAPPISSKDIAERLRIEGVVDKVDA
ncbi:MAG: LysR family transcriptional regulator [Myxococcales bacterium]